HETKTYSQHGGWRVGGESWPCRILSVIILFVKNNTNGNPNGFSGGGVMAQKTHVGARRHNRLNKGRVDLEYLKQVQEELLSKKLGNYVDQGRLVNYEGLVPYKI
ncbi:hypothetical protein Tco_1558229, partial [Tanacetum coccineum]